MNKGAILLPGACLTLALLAVILASFALVHGSIPQPLYAATSQYETPSFIQVGKVYALQDPQLARISILQIGGGGWVQIRNQDNEVLWLNLGAIKVMQEVAK